MLVSQSTPTIHLLDSRFDRAVERLCRLGPRAVAETFREIGATTFTQTVIEQAVARCAGLDPELVRSVGGDQFPAVPIRVVKQP